MSSHFIAGSAAAIAEKIVVKSGQSQIAPSTASAMRNARIDGSASERKRASSCGSGSGRGSGADDGELFLERRRAEVLTFDDGRVKNASYNASEGFGLRAVRGETAGYGHSTEISEAALMRAAETARLAVGDGGGTMASAPQATNRRLYVDDDPMADAEFPVKVETLAQFVGAADCGGLERQRVVSKRTEATRAQQCAQQRSDLPKRSAIRGILAPIEASTPKYSRPASVMTTAVRPPKMV